MRWYVYVYYDEDHQPYYCGKGCGSRAWNRRRDVAIPPRNQIVLRHFDDEDKAYQLEKDLIAFWGRQGLDPNGRLLNKALGGPGRPGAPLSNHLLSILKQGRAKGAHIRSKDFYVKPPDSDEFRIRSMEKFCRENDLDASSMIKIARGKRYVHKGWTCRYA